MSVALKLCWLLTVSLLLSCCSSPPSPPLRLGTNIWPGYEPLYLARHKKYIAEDKIQLIEFSSSSQTLQAYRNDLIDAAALTLDEVLLLLESGESLKIVLVTDISNGGDVIIAQPDITSITQLPGKRVGVENNALGAYVLARALNIANIEHDTIKLIQIDIEEHETKFNKQMIDAVVTFEPVRSKLLNTGARQIFDSSQIPGEIVDVLAVRTSYLEKNQQRIDHLLNGWYQALDYFKKKPKESAATLGLRMQLNIEDTLASYEGLILPDQKTNLELLYTNRPKLLTTARKMTKLMLNQGLLHKEIDSSSLFLK